MIGETWRRRGRRLARGRPGAAGPPSPGARGAVLAVVVGLASSLALASLVAADEPAEGPAPPVATATAEGPAGDEGTLGDEAGECPADSPASAGPAGGQGDAEGGEGCEPPATEEPPPPDPVDEPEEGAEGGCEAGGGCDPAPVGESPPAEAVAQGGEGGPGSAAPQRNRAATGGAKLRRGATLDGGSPRVRRGATLDSGRAASGGTRAAPPSSARRAGGAVRGGATGGTAVRAAPPDLGWAGPWAIPWPLVACESGGDYGALNPASGAGGAYQIIPSTWRAYGGTGLPQAAPPSEQDRIAALIWADSGPAAWACAWDGRYLGFGQAGALGSLPDPLPPARRLDAGFLSLLVQVARAHRVDWGLLLAVVRVRGGRGPAPASAAELRRLAGRIGALGHKRVRTLARRLFERRREMLRVTALAQYNRAVGRRGLVRGLKAVGERLGRRVLASKRLRIYPGGRADIRAGRVDVRVLTLLLYLARRYDPVEVASLVSGHSFLTTAGRPSNHAFGQAVDVTALNERPILGNQQPGGLTERALRWILLMPRELQAEELISLFDLGGPSFAAPDHADHIHVGF